MDYNNSIKKILFCCFHPDENETYTPLDIGYILAKLKQKKEPYSTDFVQLSYRPEWDNDNLFASFDSRLIELYNPDAVFFFLDNILWSANIALGRVKKIVSILKKKNQNLFIGFQSYKITEEEQKEIFLNGLADCVIRDNPIKAFDNLKAILKRGAVKDVFYSEVGNLRKTDGLEFDLENTTASLDYLPSPYLQGIFDNFLAKSQLDQNGFFEAFLYSSWGCPFGCFYCFRSIKSNKVRFFSVKRFYDEIEYLLDNFKIKSFFVIDDVFVADIKRLTELISEFERRKKLNKALEAIQLRIMTRPEFLAKDTIAVLNMINVSWIQIGLQTVNPLLQKYMTRTMPVEIFKDIFKNMHKLGIKIHLDVIMGLPGDTIEYFKKTVDFALTLNPASMQIKQLYLIPGTHFFNQQKNYQIETRNSVVDVVFPFVTKAEGEVDSDYINNSVNYVRDKIKKNPQISWKLLWMNGYLVNNINK